jgi:hypothetical protein
MLWQKSFPWTTHGVFYLDTMVRLCYIIDNTNHNGEPL